MQTNHAMNLKTRLFNAFASRPRPAADQILGPAVSEYEGRQLREFLTGKTAEELTAADLRTIVGSNLWMLTPDAFLYFLPAFLHMALASNDAVSVFASELIEELIEPAREDVVSALDQLEQNRSELRLPDEMIELLRKQQLEWIDSGAPTATFHERFDKLTREEGAAILAFLVAFEEAYGEDFPFGELETAIERYWSRYQDA